MRKKTKHFICTLALGCLSFVLPVSAQFGGDGEDTCDPERVVRTFFTSVDESTGPKYRKIGLNGFPIPDEKPQQTEETDAEPEETFVDAFNHTLTHQVTDIYVPMQGTDLALAVRRNWTPEIWNFPASGLRPSHNRPDRPFGEGWRSNIGACIMFSYPFDNNEPVHSPGYATVTDENGASYRFLIMPYTPDGLKFFPMPEHRHQQEVLATSLEKVGAAYIFRKKFGTELTFTAPESLTIPAYNKSSTIPPPTGTVYRWARLDKVKDRFGTEVLYTFPDADALLPTSISCRGKTITIEYTDGRVSSVTDPRGNTTTYTYSSLAIEPLQTATTLTKVLRDDGSETLYGYDGTSILDGQPRDWSDPALGNRFYHLDLSSIEDPNNHTFTFEYAFDLSRSVYMYADFHSGWYQPTDNPRNLTTITLPDGGVAHFVNDSEVRMDSAFIGGPIFPQGNKTMKVTDANGGQWVYDFTEAIAVRLDEFEDMVIFDADPLHRSVAQMILYQKMTVSTPEGGSMVAEFDKTAGMALKSFKDVGMSDPTTFEYGDVFDFDFLHPWPNFPTTAKAQIPTVKWADPTKETDGDGNSKEFAYDSTWRVMKSIKDQEGRFTSYTIDSSNGNRTKEKIAESPSGGTVQETDYDYGSGTFSGIVTRKAVQKLGGDPGWASDLVTTYGLQTTTGNVLSETVGGTSTTNYTYDANNNKLTTTDPNGNVTHFTYDSINRLTDINPPGSGSKSIHYDARGNKIREDDELGHSTRWEYDAMNRVTKQKRDMSSGDLVTNYTYDKLGSKLTTTSPNGWTTTMEYDGLRRLKKMRDPLGGHTNFTYGTNSGGLQFGRDFQPTRKTDPRGFETVVTYDSHSRPTQTRVAYGGGYATTNNQYDKVGNITRQTDPLGHVTKFEYDALNRETRRQLAFGTPLSATIDTFYTGTGLKWKVEDELNRDTLTEYDNKGRPVKVSSPVVDNGYGTNARAVTQTVYDDAGNVVETINPLGRSWTYTYDNRNRKLTETRPGTGSPTLHWQYDAVGNVIKTTDARGNETETTYDAANRVTQVKAPAVPIYPSGTTRPITLTQYDKNGNVTKVTDPNGHETNNTYDRLDHLLTTTDAEGIVVTNEYDAVGNRTAVIDGKGNRTEFEYDGLKRNTKVTDAAGKYTSFEYNALNKIARVDALSHRTEYEYDERNRLVEVNYIGGTVDNREMTYDAVGNLLTVIEPDASKAGKADVAYSYDALKRQLTETSSGLTHAYKYDLAGNRIYALYGGLSNALVSTYDEQNRLSTLTENSRVTAYTYDADGNNLTRVLPNGDTTTSTYDALNRATSMAGVTGGSAALYSYAYLYDAAGNVKTVTETYGNTALNRVVTNAYDHINRLTDEVVTGSGAATTTYTYDDANNRESMTKGGVTTSYTYNNLNQLTMFTDGTNTTTYTYDFNGNRVTKARAPQFIDYAYDYENRVLNLYEEGPTPQNTVLMYDYRGRRVELYVNLSTHTKVSFSGGTSVREFKNTVADVDYIRGSDWGGGVGGILYSLRSGTPSYTHYNRRGDVTAKTNSSGTVTYQATYEAFGKRVTETGSTADRQKSNTKDEDHPGYANEGFRFRDLETGTFISRDPAGFVDGPNLYTYVNQNPWTKFDPEGLFWKEASDFAGGSAVGALEVATGQSAGPSPGNWVANGRAFGRSTATIFGGLLAIDGAKNAGGGAAVLGVAGFATAGTAGAALPVSGPVVAVAGTNIFIGGAEMAVGGYLVSNASKLDPITQSNSSAEGSSPSGSAKEVSENNKGTEGPVKPGDTGTYGELKAQKRANGETEPLDMDHQPSFAAQVKAKETALGRPLEPQELAKLKANTPAVASPRSIHRNSPTYGGRNTPAQTAADAADLGGAQARDKAAFDKDMSLR